MMRGRIISIRFVKLAIILLLAIMVSNIKVSCIDTEDIIPPGTNIYFNSQIPEYNDCIIINDTIDPFYVTDDVSGVTIYNKDKCCIGYTLCGILPFLPNTKLINSIFNLQPISILIDMNGTVIKQWNTNPHPIKMMPSGSIISGTGRNYGGGEMCNLTQLDWNGSIEWNFCNWNIDKEGKNISRQHHDFQREGNPVGYYAPGQDFIENGKTLVLAHNTTYNRSISYKTLIFDDVIYEVNWDGTLTNFTWLASEHINEMGFTIKSRIGMWINPGGPGQGLLCPNCDLLHINSVSYLGENKWYDMGYKQFNPNNIIISSRHANFIAIIDKESGDIVWKVGPFFQKNIKENKLGQIIGPHHAHIIPKSLPGEGNILVFDNGGSAGYGLFGNPTCFRFYSKIIEFNPLTLEIVWEYDSRKGFSFIPGESHKFFTPVLGSVQRLPNGNTLISEGLSRRIFEVTPENEIVWEYYFRWGFKLNRCYRVPPEWVPDNQADYPFWEK